MMYYRLGPSIDQEVIGMVEIQSAHSVVPGNYSFDNRHLGVHYFRRIEPGDDVVIPQPILEARAKRTDLISSGMSGIDLLISPKLKSILEKCNHTGSQFIPITLYDHAVPLSYWLLHTVEPDMGELDYEKSEFQIITDIGRFLRNVEISDRASFEAMQTSVADNERVSISNVVIRSDCPSDLLLIRYVFGGVGFFVSEKLRAEIEEAGCTGIRFIPGDKDF